MSCRIRRVDTLTDADIEGLAAVLLDCIDGGASVGFMQPFVLGQALAGGRGRAADVEAGKRVLLGAEDEHGIVGTVQLILDQPENQPHRADLAKMLVHPRARRRGLGTALMRAAEEMGRECGRTLLVLDTIPDSDAERLYVRLGWIRVGTIPDYALLARGGLSPTTVFYRRL